jgi:NAD(P)H-flavin reductase
LDAITSRSRLLTLDLNGRPFRFRAGQAVMVSPPGSKLRRAYSIASSPSRSALISGIELLVSLGHARPEEHDLGSLTAGATVDVEGPLGLFVLPEQPTQTHLLCIAGGTGIAPVRAILDEACKRHPNTRLSLMYSARRADEFAFRPEFEALAAAGRLELHRTVTRNDGAWIGSRGRISRQHLQSVLHEPGNTLCFVCGPPEMVTESVTTLMAMGVPDIAICREQWGKT